MMNSKDVKFLAIAGLGLGLGSTSAVVLPSMTNITTIVVRSEQSSWLAVKWITNTQEVQKIISFVNQERQGWEQPELTVASVGKVVLDLYNGSHKQATFGIGQDFFGAERKSEIYWKRATKAKQRELLRRLGRLPRRLKDVVLPKVSEVTQILVLANGALGSKMTITNATQIQGITTFLNRYRTGWDVPPRALDQPPDLNLNLKINGRSVRQFTVGEGFFETVCDTDIIPRYRKATKRERAEIMKLAGRIYGEIGIGNRSAAGGSAQ